MNPSSAIARPGLEKRRQRRWDHSWNDKTKINVINSICRNPSLDRLSYSYFVSKTRLFDENLCLCLQGSTGHVIKPQGSIAGKMSDSLDYSCSLAFSRRWESRRKRREPDVIFLWIIAEMITWDNPWTFRSLNTCSAISDVIIPLSPQRSATGKRQNTQHLELQGNNVIARWLPSELIWILVKV